MTGMSALNMVEVDSFPHEGANSVTCNEVGNWER